MEALEGAGELQQGPERYLPRIHDSAMPGSAFILPWLFGCVLQSLPVPQLPQCSKSFTCEGRNQPDGDESGERGGASIATATDKPGWTALT